MTYRIAAIKRGDTYQLVDADGKVLLKQINGDVAKQLHALLLHEVDLEFCRGCFHHLESLDHNTQSHLVEAYWTSCIVRFFKCFGHSKARKMLSPSEIFRVKTTADFDYFRALRNKHVVHDENPYSDVLVTVAINASPTEPPFVEVFGSPIHLSTVQADLGRLRSLVSQALEFVTKKRRLLEQELTSTYEQLSRERLLALPDLVIGPTSESDVSVTRL